MRGSNCNWKYIIAIVITKTKLNINIVIYAIQIYKQWDKSKIDHVLLILWSKLNNLYYTF